MKNNEKLYEAVANIPKAHDSNEEYKWREIIHDHFEPDLMNAMTKTMPKLYMQDAARAAVTAIDYLVDEWNKLDNKTLTPMEEFINKNLEKVSQDFMVTIINYRYMNKEQLEGLMTQGDAIARYVLEQAEKPIIPEDQVKPERKGIITRIRQGVADAASKGLNTKFDDVPHSPLSFGSSMFKNK
jgi:serine protease inhibitor